jgi:imidazolonepropionase-like amidohydrolase
MTTRRIVVLLILAVLGAALFGTAQSGDLLIKNGCVLTVTRGVLERADVLIRGGVILAVGPEVEAPPGIRTVDASGKYVLPGIIDSHTHIALSGTNEGTELDTAEVDMSDVINADDPSIFTALSGGVTMIHTMHGSANPIGGQNVVLKLKWGKPSEEMLVPEAFRTLKFALGENPKQSSRAGTAPPRYPQSRMGINAFIRREMLRARAYMDAWDRYLARKQSPRAVREAAPPRRDLRLEALADLLRGKMLARVHSYRADETLEFIGLSREFGFKIACFEHIPEAFKITRELKEAGVGTSVFLDMWAYKVEAAEGIAPSAAACVRDGLLVSLNSDSGERIRRLFNDAGKALKYGGLTEEEALRLITINPAIQLGVDRIVGSLEPGKHGDVAVFNEHPLSAYARCDLTVIEGEVVFDREAYVRGREAAEKAAGEKPRGGAR